MPPEESVQSVSQLFGYVQRVNVLAREMTLLVQGMPWVFDVPNDCRIYLNRAQVKLRFLQAMDRALVEYRQTPDGLVAQAIRVGEAVGIPPSGS